MTSILSRTKVTHPSFTQLSCHISSCFPSYTATGLWEAQIVISKGWLKLVTNHWHHWDRGMRNRDSSERCGEVYWVWCNAYSELTSPGQCHLRTPPHLNLKHCKRKVMMLPYKSTFRDQNKLIFSFSLNWKECEEEDKYLNKTRWHSLHWDQETRLCTAAATRTGPTAAEPVINLDHKNLCTGLVFILIFLKQGYYSSEGSDPARE